VDRLVGPNRADIGFRNAGQHLDLLQVRGNLEQHLGRHAGHHGLAFVHVARDNDPFTGERMVVVIQIGLDSSSAARLCSTAARTTFNCAGQTVAIGDRRIQVRFGKHVALGQILGADQFLFGLRQFWPGLARRWRYSPPGWPGPWPSPPGYTVGSILRDEVAFLDLNVVVDVQFLDRDRSPASRPAPA